MRHRSSSQPITRPLDLRTTSGAAWLQYRDPAADGLRFVNDQKIPQERSTLVDSSRLEDARGPWALNAADLMYYFSLERLAST
jgi:hypothetical protein